MSYGEQTRNPHVDDHSAPEDETRFACSCGDAACIGDNTDPANLKIGSAWYASDCVMANNHPEVVRQRELDAIYDRSRR